MNIKESVENLSDFNQVNCKISEEVVDSLREIVLNNSSEAIIYFKEIISDTENVFFSDVFLVNLLECLGAACLDTWVDEILVLALFRKDIDVRDTAAKMLDFHGRYDLIRQNQDRVPWMRNYIEAVMLNDNGQDA